MAMEPVRVLVTGAAGQIGYALAPMIARGVMLGPDQPVILHMLDISSAAKAMNDVKRELIDDGFPLLRGVVATTDAEEACTGVNVAVMIVGFPRKEGMERKDVMSRNVSTCKAQASAIERSAAPNCKILIVADPVSTNALILKGCVPLISEPEMNITCLASPDHNGAFRQISEKPSVQESDVDNVFTLGNLSLTQGIENFTKRRIKRRALSTARSACYHIHDWVHGTPEGTWVSMGVYSDGSYNVPAGLFYSFPVTCRDGEWKIVQGLSIDEFSRKKLDLTAQKLAEETALAYSRLS